MNDADLPPFIEETIPLSRGCFHVIIRTRHGVYAQATLDSREKVSGWFKIYRIIALERLRSVYSATTYPLEHQPIDIDLKDVLGGSAKPLPLPKPSTQ